MTTFISYSRVNSDFAVRLAKDLKAAGLDIWFDKLDIPTGSRWDDEIEKALNKSETFLIILSPESIQSQNVKDEVGYAIDAGKQILPVVIKNCNVPFRLRRFQYVDFTNKVYEDSLIEIQHLLAVPSTPVILGASKNNPNQAKNIEPIQKPVENKQPKKPKPDQTLIFIVIIGAALFCLALAAMGLYKLVGSMPTPSTTDTVIPSKPNVISPVSPATSTPTIDTSSIQPSNTEAQVSGNRWSEIISARMPTLNEIREDMLSIWDANNLSLGDMVSPGIRSFSGTAKPTKEYLWPIFWCAIDKSTLDVNVKNIDTVFTVDEEQVPNEYVFDYDYDTPNGWKCNYHATVISKFPKNTPINLQVTRTFKSKIFDGDATYPAGVYTYKLVILAK